MIRGNVAVASDNLESFAKPNYGDDKRAILRILRLQTDKMSASLYLPSGRVKHYTDMELLAMTNGMETKSQAASKLMILDYHLSLGFLLMGSSNTASGGKDAIDFYILPPKAWQ